MDDDEGVAEVEVAVIGGLILDDGTGGDVTVVSFTIDAGRIVAIDSVRNPEKLRHVTLEEAP
jgi:hypothetical protein